MKTVNILGMGPSADGLPAHLEGERWGINFSYIYSPLDRLFVVHDFDEFLLCANKPGRNHFYSLQALTDGTVKELWTTKPLEVALPIHQLNDQNVPADYDEEHELLFSHVPTSSAWQERLAAEGARVFLKSHRIHRKKIAQILRGEYYTSTLPFVIGQAIAEGFERIVLYGVEVWELLGQGTYGDQERCVNDVCRAAVTLGIDVQIPWQVVVKINDRLFRKGR